MNISNALASATEILAKADIAEPRREAASLLAFVLQKDAAFLIAHADDALAANQKLLFESCVRRRAKHEPFQYIVGRQEFYGLDFVVTPDVLIPRPETEILVENAVALLSDVAESSFLEIGVGSGCISVSVLHSVAKTQAVGVDISQEAITVARRNAERHNVTERLDFIHGDIFEEIIGNGKFDLIVSNPPYVPSDHIDSLQAEVRDFEPRMALDGGDEGLSIIATIIHESPKFLKTKGFLLLEIGFDQSAKANELFDLDVWNAPEFIDDLQGIPRIVKVQKV